MNPHDSTHPRVLMVCWPYAIMAVIASMLICLGLSAAAHADDGPVALEQTIDPNQQQGTGQVVLEQGHIDFGPTLNTGSWTMEIHDDTGDVSYWRMPQDVVMHLTSSSIIDMPAGDTYGFIGEKPGTPLWVVPQTQNPDVVWVGWNTQEPNVLDQFKGGMTLSLEGVDGPGDLDVYLENGNFSAPSVVWTTKKAYPQDSWIEVNAHTHVNWVFHKEGVYKVKLTLKGELKDGRQVSDTNTLRFAVGDDVDPQSAFDGATTDAGSDDDTGTSEDQPARSQDGDSQRDDRKAAAQSQQKREAESRRQMLLLISVIAGVIVAGIAVIVLLVSIRAHRDRIAALREADDGPGVKRLDWIRDHDGSAVPDDENGDDGDGQYADGQQGNRQHRGKRGDA